MQLVTIMKIIATRAINTASQRFVGGAGLYWANPGARLTNAEAIARSIDELQAELEQLKTALGAKDAAELEKFFAEGKSGRDGWLESLEKK